MRQTAAPRLVLHRAARRRRGGMIQRFSAAGGAVRKRCRRQARRRGMIGEMARQGSQSLPAAYTYACAACALFFAPPATPARVDACFRSGVMQMPRSTVRACRYVIACLRRGGAEVRVARAAEAIFTMVLV